MKTRRIIGLTPLIAAVAAAALAVCGGNGGSNPCGGGTGSAKVEKGTFTYRNQTYKTVKIGGQKWFAENLNPEYADSWCPGEKSEDCAKYGKLYTWKSAKEVCPKGWHLPTREEWGELAEFAGGLGDYGVKGAAAYKLKTKSGWNANGGGSDEFGFSALPGGMGKADPSGAFSSNNTGNIGCWWTATESSGESAYLRNMSVTSNKLMGSNYEKNTACSVRCLAD